MLFTTNMNPAVLSGQTSISVTFLASFLIWFMFAGLLGLWLFDGRVKREEAFHALFATLLAWVIAEMIKNLFPISRPFEVNGSIPMTLTVPFDSAFPSSHAASAFALAVSVWLHDKKIGFFFLASAFLVGLGRVLGNVHSYTDIFAGAILGLCVAYIIDKLHLFKLVK